MRWLLLFAFSCFCAACQASYYYTTLSEKKLNKLFASRPFQPVSHFVQVGEYPLHYVSIGEPTKEFMLLMIHGSPGLWNNYLDFFQDEFLLDNFFIVSPDRAGYGQSSRRGIHSLQKEACHLGSILTRYPDKRVLLVGHSYGGPLAVQMQWQYPTRVVGTLLLAPPLDPAYENMGPWRYLLRLPVISHLTPRHLAASNEEMMCLPYGLMELAQHYRELTQPVYYIHGTNDWFVSYENLAYAKQRMAHLPLTAVSLEGANHFIPWTHYDEVIKGIKYLHSAFAE